jgi:hypothetical protein
MNDLFPVADAHDPGGKTRIRIPAGWRVEAEFDGAGDCYRYTLMHRWSDGPMAAFLMMNPSTADYHCLDPTVAKTARISKRLGFGGQFIGNACSYRVTDRMRLLEVKDPVGPLNLLAIERMASLSKLIVIAHGLLPGDLQRHADAMCHRLLGHKLHVLRLTKSGAPSHPLYIPESVIPQPWAGPAVTEEAA